MKTSFAQRRRPLEIQDAPDLFGTATPAGFRYTPNVLTEADQRRFVEKFEKLPLKPFEFHGHVGNRRIYSFGHKYVFAGQMPGEEAGIHDYFKPLISIAGRISGKPAAAFEQIMVTEYAPGAGIGWHRDRLS
jgi:alkylated DNA repair dioxygenase AlkB